MNTKRVRDYQLKQVTRKIIKKGMQVSENILVPIEPEGFFEFLSKQEQDGCAGLGYVHFSDLQAAVYVLSEAESRGVNTLGVSTVGMSSDQFVYQSASVMFNILKALSAKRNQSLRQFIHTKLPSGLTTLMQSQNNQPETENQNGN